MSFPVFRLLVQAAVLVCLCFASAAETVEDLNGELAKLAKEIAEAETVARSDGSEDVRRIAKLRLEVLALSRALIRNRILVIEGDVARRIVVSELEPDQERARELSNDLRESAGRVSDAVEDVGTLSGVEKSLAEVRLQTERLAYAQLSLAYLQAKHGILVPVSQDSVSTRGADEVAGQAAQTSVAGVATGIDAAERSPLLRRELARGARIEGWWTIVSSANESTVAALNHSAYGPRIDGSRSGALIGFECGDGLYGLSVTLPGMVLTEDAGEVDVVYRIGDAEPRYDSWSVIPGGRGAVKVGREAYDLLRRMTRADDLVIEVWDADNTLHTGRFELDGAFEVSLEADQVCSSGVSQAAPKTDEEPVSNIAHDFARQDYRLIQTLLNIAGFSVGGADGIWGPRSQAAMRQYQHSAGLPETGHPAEEVLELLGLN